MDFYGSIEFFFFLFDFTAGDFTLLHGSFKFLAHIRGSFHVRFRIFPPLVIISGVFLLFVFSLTISLLDSQEHHHGADEEHSSDDASRYHVRLLLQRRTRRTKKHTCTSVVGRSVPHSHGGLALFSAFPSIFNSSTSPNA